MDILNTLKQKGKNLYLDELEFFEIELDTGDYSETYINECMNLINNIKKWKKSQNASPTKTKKNTTNFNNIILDHSALLSGYSAPSVTNLTLEEQVKQEIEKIRKKTDYAIVFRNFITSNDNLNEKMIEQLFKFFMQWELDELLINKSFSEEFLEKFFSDLDHAKIARYQYFSENFFMKHFNDLSYTTVLQKGVNEWRKKANRSSKLDLFLRLKGVTI